MACVYMHIVNDNNKIYIGQCNGDPKIRWGSNGHRYKSQYFYKAINKYGWDNIDHIILATNLSQEQANELEKKLIIGLHSNDRQFGYNIEAGGKIGSGLPGRLNPNARSVVCIETQQTWECSTFCAKEIGVNLATLQESLYRGYRCKGLHYKYTDDKNYIQNPDPQGVICIETGEKWKNVKECAKSLNVHHRSVARYCSGLRKPTSGLTYKYCVV